MIPCISCQYWDNCGKQGYNKIIHYKQQLENCSAYKPIDKADGITPLLNMKDYVDTVEYYLNNKSLYN